jgi:hypothetical protein
MIKKGLEANFETDRFDFRRTRSKRDKSRPTESPLLLLSGWSMYKSKAMTKKDYQDNRVLYNSSSV